MIETVFWLALNIFHEAKFQPPEGQEAVGIVTLNRAIRKNKPVKEIIYEPYQFSWTIGHKNKPVDNFPAFIKCLGSALKAIDRVSNGDNMEGIEFYFNPSLANPNWKADKVKVITIADHDFYRS